jgi:hypothetical protein
LRGLTRLGLIATIFMLAGTQLAYADDGGVTPAPAQAAPGNVGGADPTAPSASQGPDHPTVPGVRAVFRHGIAYAPAAAPLAVQQAIWAGNKLRHQPYVYGGGHQSFRSNGYDCSGTVSYVLHAASLLTAPLDSSSFMHWGQRGKGQWITIYTNPGHAFVVIAGLRLDTSQAGDNYNQGDGPRWRTTLRSTKGFRAVHPVNY